MSLSEWVCHSWEVFPLSVASFCRKFIVIKLLLYKRFFRLEKKQLLRIKWRRFLNELLHKVIRFFICELSLCKKRGDIEETFKTKTKEYSFS